MGFWGLMQVIMNKLGCESNSIPFKLEFLDNQKECWFMHWFNLLRIKLNLHDQNWTWFCSWDSFMQIGINICVLQVRREVAESVFTQEPKVGDKQSCLVTQDLSHGSRKGRAKLKPKQGWMEEPEVQKVQCWEWPNGGVQRVWECGLLENQCIACRHHCANGLGAGFHGQHIPQLQQQK